MSDQNEQTDSAIKTADMLAYERTILAQERTLMAAIRTSVSMISFGFTIAKFFQDLRGVETLKHVSNISSRNVGYWLVFIGTAYIISFSIQHELVLRSLRVKGVKKRVSFTFMLAIVVAILGLALLISFYLDVFSLGINK